MAIELERVARAAAAEFLRERDTAAVAARDGRPSRPRRHGLGGAGSLALGVAVGIAARGAYRRAQRLDLEQLAHAVERRLTG